MARAKPLHGVFTAIPRHYDLVNHVITWCLDMRWRRRAARECLTNHPRKILDLGCGTGDLALNLARLSNGNTEVIAIDYSRPMLAIASVKVKKAGLHEKISLLHGDVASLPFPDGYFDSIGISFAFRNLTYKNPLTGRYLAEVFRILAPDGRFVIAESSQPKSRLIRGLFHLYLRWFVFRAGYWLSGNRGAYQYLAESARRFYIPDEVKDLLLAVGFKDISYQPLLLGAAGIYVAIR
jgi:demethylmenaquinone methyltransferase/2-methoxy-6-polyprenyl-1,4-benzoquinol methylase